MHVRPLGDGGAVRTRIAQECSGDAAGASVLGVRLKSDGYPKEMTWTNEVPIPGSGFVF